jgi:hypothetical protein
VGRGRRKKKKVSKRKPQIKKMFQQSDWKENKAEIWAKVVLKSYRLGLNYRQPCINRHSQWYIQYLNHIYEEWIFFSKKKNLTQNWPQKKPKLIISNLKSIIIVIKYTFYLFITQVDWYIPQHITKISYIWPQFAQNKSAKT